MPKKAYKDLPAFIAALEEAGQLARVAAEVSPYLEAAEIYDRVVKAGGKALLFERISGSPYPLLVNAFGSAQRLDLAFGGSLEAQAERIAGLIDMQRYAGLAGKIASLPELAATLLSLFPVKLLGKAPCQEVVEEADLSKLPILTTWPGDAGPFITLPIVVTRDPETGAQNMGMYRLQVYDQKTTGMHWHLHKDGRSIFEKYRRAGRLMPVSVAVGCDPATIYAATAPLPSMIDEALFAGFLRGRPLEQVKSILSDIMVPARAEFILEGYVDPREEFRTEGPFGDHTGYYSLAAPYPVFHVEKITRKKKPVFMATAVGKPPMEDCFLGKATERLFLPLLKLQLPEIVDISFPLEGVFHNCLIVAIDKAYPGHARKVMQALWGSGQMMYTKLIVVVDKDVKPSDYSTVAWKVFNNIDAGRDLELSKGPLDALDHASPQPHFGTRLGVDATRKLPEEGHGREWPEDIGMSPEIKALVDSRWKDYGL